MSLLFFLIIWPIVGSFWKAALIWLLAEIFISWSKEK